MSWEGNTRETEEVKVVEKETVKNARENMMRFFLREKMRFVHAGLSTEKARKMSLEEEDVEE